jgi:hypothetical protein
MMLLGQVSSVAASGFQMQPIYTMPISVTVSLSTTTITVAGMPGTMADIQSGRFVNVAGHFDTTQQTLDASRVDVVVPTVTGSVTAVNGATFSMLSDRGATFQVTTTSSTTIMSLSEGRHHGHTAGLGHQPGSGGPGNQEGEGESGSQQGQGGSNSNSSTGPISPTITLATGDWVAVQAFPPAAGSNAITALRMTVGAAMAGPGTAPTGASD